MRERASLVVLCLRLSAPNAGDLSVIRGWGTGIQFHHFIKIDGGKWKKYQTLFFQLQNHHGQ